MIRGCATEEDDWDDRAMIGEVFKAIEGRRLRRLL